MCYTPSHSQTVSWSTYHHCFCRNNSTTNSIRSLGSNRGYSTSTNKGSNHRSYCTKGRNKPTNDGSVFLNFSFYGSNFGNINSSCSCSWVRSTAREAGASKRRSKGKCDVILGHVLLLLNPSGPAITT